MTIWRLELAHSLDFNPVLGKTPARRMMTPVAIYSVG
jgi:hypothetical protein